VVLYLSYDFKKMFLTYPKELGWDIFQKHTVLLGILVRVSLAAPITFNDELL
jgi:hypothetical protein